MYSPQHSAARKRRPLRRRIIGSALAASATVVTGVTLGPPAQAASVWDRVAACESTGNWAINSGNGYYGGLQFSASTWANYGGIAYASSANLASRAAQITVAQRVLAAQGPGAWPVCGGRAGLTAASGAARAGLTAAAGSARAMTVSRSTTRVAIAMASSQHRTISRLVVDGILGPKTTRALQRRIGTAQNGVFGSGDVKALQRKVGARADGVIGPLTVRALQFKVGARRDGARHLNRATVAATQRYLNRH